MCVPLLRAAATEKPGLQFLRQLDSLLMDLKNIQIPARHCANQHASPEWQAAGAEVAAAADKYEAFVLQNDALQDKLSVTYSRALQQLQDHMMANRSGQSGGGGRGSAPPPVVTELATALLLVERLDAMFSRGGVNVEQGISHLLCLQVRHSLLHVHITPACSFDGSYAASQCVLVC